MKLILIEIIFKTEFAQNYFFSKQNHIVRLPVISQSYISANTTSGEYIKWYIVFYLSTFTGCKAFAI